MNPRTTALGTLANNNPSIDEFLTLTKDTTKLVRDRIMLHNYSMARLGNKSMKDCTLKVVDQVLLSTKSLSLKDEAGTRKLNSRFRGPLIILKMISNVTAKLDPSKPMKAIGIHDICHASFSNRKSQMASTDT